MGTSEQIKEWGYDEGEGGLAARRVFITGGEVTGSDTVPDIGDAHPDPSFYGLPAAVVGVDLTSFTCKDRKWAVYGKQGTLKVSCIYDARPQDPGEVSGVNFDPADLPVQLDMGGEFLEVSASAKWKWKSDGADVPTDPAQDEDAIRLTKRLITGTYTTEIVEDTFKLKRYLESLGKVNSAEFRDVAAGHWLVAGFSQTEFYDNNGNRRYRVRPTIVFRSVDGSTTSGHGWNYVWRKDTGEFDTPLIKDGNTPIYSSTNINDLFR